MEFSLPEYWGGEPFSSPEDLPLPGIEPGSPTLQADSLPSEPPGKPQWFMNLMYNFKIFRHAACGHLVALKPDGLRVRSGKSFSLKTSALESAQVVPFPGTPSPIYLPGQHQFSLEVSARIPDCPRAGLGSEASVHHRPSQHSRVSAAWAVWRPD